VIVESDALSDRPAEAQPAAGDTGWRRPLLLAVGIVVGVRLLLSIWAAFVLANFPTTDLQAQYAHVGFPLQSGGLAAPWEREDALWYEKIATLGYSPDDGSSVFLPLLPLLMRLVSTLTLGNMALAGIVVSSAAAVAALALLYRFATLDGGADVGLRSVMYLALFPTAFFLYSAFTESLFLALAIGAFWCGRRGRWLLAALLAGLAGLTKVQGALLFLPLAVEYLVWAGWRPAVVLRRAGEFAAVLLAAPLATGAFFAYISSVVGDPLPWSARVTAMWQFRSTWPGETLAVAVQKVLAEGGLTINAFDLAVLALFAVLTVASFRLRPSYGFQALTALAPSLLRVNADFPLMSLSRYALAAFPCFIVLAIWSTNRPRIVHLVIVTLWVSLLLVWSSQFVRGYWVG
jgi:hypothetical protein